MRRKKEVARESCVENNHSSFVDFIFGIEIEKLGRLGAGYVDKSRSFRWIIQGEIIGQKFSKSLFHQSHVFKPRLIKFNRDEFKDESFWMSFDPLYHRCNIIELTSIEIK